MNGSIPFSVRTVRANASTAISAKLARSHPLRQRPDAVRLARLDFEGDERERAIRAVRILFEDREAEIAGDSVDDYADLVDLIEGRQSATRCSSGARSTSPCYLDQILASGRPRSLAVGANERVEGARAAALNNIDNYLSYMWNRMADHDFDMLVVVDDDRVAGTSKPASTGRGKGKPVG